MSHLIPLTQGKNAIVDLEDYETLQSVKWFAQKSVTRKGTIYWRACHSVHNHKPKVISMAHFLMNCPDGMTIDHINHNALDNRKSNLRVCSQAQNTANRKKYTRIGNSKCASKFKGVNRTFRKGNQNKPWRAIIYLNKQKVSLGYFHTDWEAAIAYDQASKHYFGEHTCRNF